MIGMGNQLNEIGGLRGQPVMEGILIVDLTGSLQGSLLLYLRKPCFKRSNFQESIIGLSIILGDENRRSHRDKTRPTSAFGATRGPSVVKIRCLSSFPEGKGSQRTAGMGSFGGDELTDYHAFGHMSVFKQSEKTTDVTQGKSDSIPQNYIVLGTPSTLNV